MRKWIIGTGLVLAACTAAFGQDASEEIVTGFLGGTSQPVDGNDAVIAPSSVPASDAPAAVRHGKAARNSTRRGGFARQATKTRLELQPIIIPRPPQPIPGRALQPEYSGALAGVQWGHPAAIGAGLVPVALAALFAGIRAARLKKFAGRGARRPDVPQIVDVPADGRTSVPLSQGAGDQFQKNQEARIARRFRTGQGEIRLARLIERSPKTSIRKMQDLAGQPPEAGGDAGIARNLHVGRGEVRLAIRLQQLSAQEQIPGELQ